MPATMACNTAADQLGTTLERTAHQSQNAMEVQAQAYEQYQQHDVASIMSDLQKAIDRLTERLAIERAQVGRGDSLTEMEPISGDDKPSGDNHPQRSVYLDSYAADEMLEADNGTISRVKDRSEYVSVSQCTLHRDRRHDAADRTGNQQSS